MRSWWHWMRVRSRPPAPRTQSRPMTIEDTARWRDDVARRVTYVEAILNLYARNRPLLRPGESPPDEGAP